MEKNIIAPNYITVADVEMPCEYRVSSTGRSITCRYTLDGVTFRVVFTGECGDIFAAALRAAKRGDTVEVDGGDLMTVLGTATECKSKVERAADPDKQAHGPVPEKWFIGQTFTGKGWKISFDGDAGKTRVIFQRKPSSAVLEAVKAAGFYWSPSMKSWNKGLNFRAFRAAEKLRITLAGLTA